MTAAPVGTIVKLYVDLREVVEPGHLIVTQTERTYQVLGVKVQMRGKHLGRQHLQCLVVDERPLQAVIHRIRWYKRRKRA